VSEETTKRRNGWTCRLEEIRRGDKIYRYWKAYKRVRGRVRSIHIGREWNRKTLKRFREKALQIEGENAARS
jgi:hypothetical protein